MKKHILLLVIALLAASPAAAQEAQAKGGTGKLEVFEGNIGPTYYWQSLDGSTRAAEYDYLKDTVGADMHIEYDPLPHRFSVETHYLNQKDYFGEMDYAYHDVVLLNILARGLYHNLDHLSFGPDDPTTPSPVFTDRNPAAQYALENRLTRAYLRFKTPDFPLHLYATATRIDRTGTIQQRFLRAYAGGLDKVSQSRDIDWSSQEATIGVNSHLGYFEADYSHAEKKFLSHGADRVLYESYPLYTAVPHNLVPDLTSSSDTIKVHTTLTGRIVAAATYSEGDKKNEDSKAKAEFKNAAGDLTLTPFGGLLIVARYRHYDLDLDTPDLVTLAGVGSTYKVRNNISSKRDVLSGVVRYRLTKRLTVKGEWDYDKTKRTVWFGNALSPLQVSPVPSGTAPDSWEVAPSTTKGTARLGLTFRIMNRLTLRADYSNAQVTDPAYADDPDKIDTAKATVTWMPLQQIILLTSYSGIRERRDQMSAPLAGGSRKTARDQALGSLTFLIGKGTSLTAGYMYYHNKTKQTLTFTDAAGGLLLENAVPYVDTAQVFTLSASQSLAEGVMVSADASKCFSEGRFSTSGTVPGSAGIDTFSDLKVVEDIYSAALELQVSRNVGSEFRYLQRHYNDKLDSSQNGRLSTALATVYVKW